MRKHSIILILALSFSAGAQSIETQTREALKSYTFKREVILQTIAPDGTVNGQITRTSVFTLDDEGNRVETDIEQSGKLKGVRLTDEDWADLNDAQLLGPDASRNGRYLAGAVSTDLEGRIVKVTGKVEPDGKQRFPRFTTYRELIDGFMFPVRIEADDILKFPSVDVRYRIKARIYDYKKFKAEVIIKDAEEDHPLVFSSYVSKGAPDTSLVGWKTGETVKVEIDPEFSADEQRAIRQAAESWNIGIVTFTFKGEGIPLSVTRGSFYKGKGNVIAYFRPWTDGINVIAAEIVLDRRLTRLDVIQSIVAHEIGHGHGLSDCRNCESIMKHKTKGGVNTPLKYMGPTEIDVKILRSVMGKE